jgi:hypothetical protein
VVNPASVATSRKYPVALGDESQFAFKEVHVKLDASVAFGAVGPVVITTIMFEFKLVLQPLLARTR